MTNANGLITLRLTGYRRVLSCQEAVPCPFKRPWTFPIHRSAVCICFAGFPRVHALNLPVLKFAGCEKSPRQRPRVECGGDFDWKHLHHIFAPIVVGVDGNLQRGGTFKSVFTELKALA